MQLQVVSASLDKVGSTGGDASRALTVNSKFSAVEPN